METVYLTKKQLAKRWGCAVITVERIAANPENQLPTYDLGGKKFKMEDVLQFEERRKQLPDDKSEDSE